MKLRVPRWQVRAIMHNDSYYQQKLGSWRHAHSRKRQQHTASPANFHCQWHDSAARAAEAAQVRSQPKSVSWEGCACHSGRVEDLENLDGARGFVAHGYDARMQTRHPEHWLPNCATPPS